MSSKTDARGAGWLAPLLVLAVALLARGPHLGEWGLWEDEETSLHFSQRPDKSFPASFPIFFQALRGVFDLTGVGVLPGRAFAAALGLLGVALTGVGFSRLWSRPVGVLAALFVALSLGHVFWSQSVRYYILLFDFQILALYWFLSGFERNRPWELVLANVALALGLWTHFSGALLMPVFVGHLMLAAAFRWTGGGYDRRGYLVFGVPFLIVSALFAWKFKQFMATQASLVEGPTNPVRLLVQVVLYFGPGTLALAALAPLVVRGWWRDRRFVFLLVAALVPVAELVVIAVLNLTIVTWYYAFFALVGFAGLAALTVTSLAERGRRVAAVGLLGLGLLGLVPLAVAYHTTFSGDRPRWKDACTWLKQERGVDPTRPGSPPVLANVPGVVAFHLGVPAAETMGHPVVRQLPKQPPAEPPAGETWYVVEVSSISPEYLVWLDRHAEPVYTAEARTGPKDRTVRVYHYRPR
jgi:hypothetical protein